MKFLREKEKDVSDIVKTSWSLGYEHLKHSCDDDSYNWWPDSQLLPGCTNREEANILANSVWRNLDKNKYRNPKLVRLDVTIENDWKPS